MSTSSNSKASNISGVGSGLFWGLDCVIVGIILAATLLQKNGKIIFLAPFVASFIKDGLSAIYITILNIARGNFGSVLKALRTKSGLFIAIGGILAGPLGMTCYMFSIRHIGPAYTANISALYPAIGALLAFIFLKEKIAKNTWIGMAISVTGIFVLGYSGGASVNGGNFFLGILFALGTALGWASECVVCAYGMKEDVSPVEAVNIRQIASAACYGIIILPLLKGHFLTGQVIMSKTIWLLALSAFVATSSYLLYYKAINMIGAAKGTALNITYALWAIVFQTIILHIPLTSQLIMGSIIITLGTTLVIAKPSEILNFKKNV